MVTPSFFDQGDSILVTIAHPLDLLSLQETRDLNGCDSIPLESQVVENAIEYLRKRTKEENWWLKEGKLTLMRVFFRNNGGALNPKSAEEAMARWLQNTIDLPCVTISSTQNNPSCVLVKVTVDHPKTIRRLASLNQPQVLLTVEDPSLQNYQHPRSLASISATLCIFNPCGYTKEEINFYQGTPDFFLAMPWVSLNKQGLVIRVPDKLINRGFLPHLEHLCGCESLTGIWKEFNNTYLAEITIPSARVEDFLTIALGFTTVQHPKKGIISFIDDMKAVHGSITNTFWTNSLPKSKFFSPLC